MFYRNAEHCEGQENREKFRLLSFFLALFLFIAVHSTIKPPLSTIMVEKALLSKNEKIANDSAK